MKPKNILLIVNPVSGRMKTKTGLFEMLDELYRKDPSEPMARMLANTVGTPVRPANTITFGDLTTATLGGEPDLARRVTVTPTMSRGHAATLAAASADEGYDTVICCGGDGTLNETVTGLMSIPPDQRPPLGYIPAGSTNDFAASIGLPTSLRGASRTAVSYNESPIDVGHFRPLGEKSHPPRYFTYIASFGIFTAASYSTSQTAKNLFGHVAYLVEGIKDIANIQPRHARFELADGSLIEGDYVFGAITNTTSAAGLVKLPADRVSLSDGLFELLLVHPPKTPADLSRIGAALLAQDFDSCPLIELYHLTSVRIRLKDNISWSLDGEEAVGGTDIEIRCLPHALSLKVNEI